MYIYKVHIKSSCRNFKGLPSFILCNSNIVFYNAKSENFTSKYFQQFLLRYWKNSTRAKLSMLLKSTSRT